MRICAVSPGGVDTPIYRQAANYQGYVGRPPPPVYSPERVAGIVVRAIDRPRNRVDAGFANPLLALGFTLLPKVYDAIVGPLFAVAATDDERVTPHAGNVGEATDEGQQLHGEQGGSAVAIAKALRRRAASLVPELVNR